MFPVSSSRPLLVLVTATNFWKFSNFNEDVLVEFHSKVATFFRTFYIQSKNCKVSTASYCEDLSANLFFKLPRMKLFTTLICYDQSIESNRVFIDYDYRPRPFQ